MKKFGKSQPVTRREDPRFLTGTGRYIDDIAPKGALRAFVLRATLAHGTITELDCADARSAPGVALVLTAQDLTEAGITRGLHFGVQTNRDGSRAAAPKRHLLADQKVVHVGEPIAVIVAETLDQAKDAAEMIALDLDPLPVKMDLAPGGPAIYDEAPDNVLYDWGQGDEEATEAAIASAAHVVTAEIPDTRIIVNSMEPRGCYAEPEGDRLHVCVNGQGVWGARDTVAKMLNLDPADVRVTTPDVGGGFGMKAMNYPELVLIAHAARQLGKPVHWMSDRSEAMQSDNAGRDLISRATLAFDQDHRITAYRVENLANMGAVVSENGQFIQADLFAKVLTGPYDIPTVWLGSKGIATNTTQVDAYRGAGRPEAIYVLERLMDMAAAQLGVAPAELREKNFVRSFPYRSATGELYDVGDFPRLLHHALDKADMAGFPTRRSAAEARGKLAGIGLCYYIEAILGSPSETARIVFTDDGGAEIYVGTQSNGQGHETVYAQFLADQTGIPVDRIAVIQGDSDRIAKGGGTGGSRSVTVQNNATLATVDQMITGFTGFLAEQHELTPDDISWDHEQFRLAGTNLTPTLLEVAQMARQAGRSDLLTHEATAKLPARSYPNGAHIAEVEIDPETGKVDLIRYTVVDDFGNLINPRLVEGQVHGGIAQGAGQVLCEVVGYDDEGQLLSASFMDYAMPRADDFPMISFTSDPVPSTSNVMGMKGCGEAGTVGSMASVANAVQDALRPHGVGQVDMPLTPQRIWQLLHGAA